MTNMRMTFSLAMILAVCLFSLQVRAQSGVTGAVITPNDFNKGSDSERIEMAIREALKTGANSIEIPRYDHVRDKPVWLIDRAILLPSDFTLYLRDCLVRLAPGTQDNIITNAGARTRPLSSNKNIRIIGSGNAVLSGGLESHWDEPGDRNGYKFIGILLYDTRHFTIEGIKMEETQGYGISVENGCAFGRISNIDFENTARYPTQDGIDVRKGCHDIIIENITGILGDDVVALNGLSDKKMKQGVADPSIKSVMVGAGIPRDNDDIYNIIVNNVKATTPMNIIRILNHDGIKIYNVFISNVMDTSQEGDTIRSQGKIPIKDRPANAIRIGDHRYWAESKKQFGDTYNIFINNVVSRARRTVLIQGPLKDCIMRNIVGYGGNEVLVEYRDDERKENVIIDAIQF
jgi:hypothetical protein